MLEFLARNRVMTLYVVTVFAFVAIGAAVPGYLRLATVMASISNSLVLMSLTLGTMLVIVTRNIDVSSGSVLGLSAVVLGLMLDRGYSLGAAIAVCVVTGAAAGLLNGLLVTIFDVPSIIATLGTLGLFRGVMLILTGGNWIEALPLSLKALADNRACGFSILSGVVIAMLIIVWLLLRHTRRGRYFQATGDNREAARHLGIPVKRVQIAAFVLAGILFAIAGMTFAAQIGFIPNQAGNGLELKAIAANVLGGVSLIGGVGTVPGIFVAVIFLTSIDSALVFLKIPAFWNEFIAGAVLLFVLLVDGRIRIALDRAIRGKRYAVYHDNTPNRYPSSVSVTPSRIRPKEADKKRRIT